MIHWCIHSFFACAANHAQKKRWFTFKRWQAPKKNHEEETTSKQDIAKPLADVHGLSPVCFKLLKHWGWGNSSAWGVCGLSRPSGSQHAKGFVSIVWSATARSKLFSSHPAFLKDKAQFMPFAAHADKQEAPWPGA